MEEMAEDFLRANDATFKKKNRKTLLEYPYLTKRQIEIRQSKEIPASSIYNNSIRQYFGEKGNYDD